MIKADKDIRQRNTFVGETPILVLETFAVHVRFGTVTSNKKETSHIAGNKRCQKKFYTIRHSPNHNKQLY